MGRIESCLDGLERRVEEVHGDAETRANHLELLFECLSHDVRGAGGVALSLARDRVDDYEVRIGKLEGRGRT